ASNDLTVSFNIWSAGDGIDCRLSWGDGTTDTFLLTKNDFSSYDNWYKKSVSHTFDDWGSYDIGLTCSDDDGHQESDTATTIQLIPPPPSLSMDLGHGSSSSDKTVQV
ncbi:MAG: hypothetical protein SVU32_05040, partial [Candidatus Nanohaloarchaea archaeon]|nr:hypothetical protein [Candidatus Nanohaloarchaea archaeon]